MASWWRSVGVAALLVGVSAEAAPAKVKPYARPYLTAGLVRVGGVNIVQARGGGEAGLVIPLEESGRTSVLTRLRAGGVYGTSSGSVGGEARLGGFLQRELVKHRLYGSVGPDFWVDSYGVPTSSDYYLPVGTGVDLPVRLSVQVLDGLSAVGFISPGLVISGRRTSGLVDPFDVMSTGVGLRLSLNGLMVDLGYVRSWTAVGAMDGIQAGIQIRPGR